MERLPECVLLQILVSIPLQQVLRLRLVCKAWNTLLSSSQFLQALTLTLHSPHLHHLPCFAMAAPPLLGSRHSGLLLYSPFLGTWLHSPFPVPSTSAPAHSPAPVMLSVGHGNLVAIADTSHCPMPRCIRVFNLLTSSHDDVFPPLPDLDPKFSSMGMFPLEASLMLFNLFIFCHDDDDGSVSLCTQSYHLVLDVQSPAHHSLLIYTSKTESWRSVSALAQCRSDLQWACFVNGLAKIDADKADQLLWNPTVSADDKADLVFWNSRERMIVEYQIASNEWEKTRVFLREPEPEDGDGLMQKTYLAGGSVFRCQGGRVVLVCADVMDERLSETSPLAWREIKGFRVWNLQTQVDMRTRGQPLGMFGMPPGMFGMPKWVQVAHSPSSFWEGYYVEWTEPKFKPKFIHDGTSMICMTSAKHSSSQQRSGAFSHNKLGRYKPPLVYNLDLDSWSYLPRCGDAADDLVGLFTFKPSFKALAQNSTTLI
eukprot:c17602_g1_i1 orf=72-1520(+)